MAKKTPVTKKKKAETKETPPHAGAAKIEKVESIYTEDITHPPVPNVSRLFMQAVRTLKKGWKVLFGLAFIYAALNLLLVQGLSATANLSVVKDSLNNISSSGIDKLTNGVSLYTYLLGNSGTSIAPTAGIFQFMIALVVSLAAIWALRQLYVGREITIRETFYYGMYPLATFFLVLLIVVIHLLPFVLGSILYGIITANGIAATVVEATSFLFLFLLLSLVSIYLLCSSLFALYIVTLPEMTPMGALRSARELVVNRRWTIMRKVLFLPLALLVLGGIVLVPVALFLTPAAPWVLTALAAVGLVFAHTYMYTLYREMI